MGDGELYALQVVASKGRETHVVLYFFLWPDYGRDGAAGTVLFKVTTLLTGSVEFEHYFHSKWGVAVFLDAGNAIDDLKDDLEQGAGFGVRWKSPVGPVRVDLANAISSDELGWRLHISIGPDL